MIESATHSIGSGYTTNIKLSMGKEAKKEAKASKTKKRKATKKKSAAKIPEDIKVYTGEKVKVVK